ncbi:MAG TPA: FHA domain-containing protein [Acidobacteriota bacterium]|nr:FHA domain-containing protein [Acidobacteriota bacterium]
MKCMLCGTENRAEAQHCKGCGASLTNPHSRPIGASPAPTIHEAAPAGDARRTRIATPEEQSAADAAARQPAAAGGARRTVYVPPEAGERAEAAARSAAPSALPRIVGFLVSYTWDHSGQVFPLREGKNTFGSRPDCDGPVTQDRAMSGQHFAVMCRAGQVRVRDLDSTNATTVDGQEIWGDSSAADHASVIKAGDTVFQVVLIPPAPEV